MKTKILSVIIANIIIIGFIIFTVFMQFGTNIRVLKKVEFCTIDVSYSQDARYNRFYGGNGIINVSTCMVKVEPDVDEIYPFWLDAKEFFNTDNEDVLRKMVDNKETVKINIFINSQTNEVIGITKSNSSKLALIYRNNKLVKFGFIMFDKLRVSLYRLYICAAQYNKEKAVIKSKAEVEFTGDEYLFAGKENRLNGEMNENCNTVRRTRKLSRIIKGA